MQGWEDSAADGLRTLASATEYTSNMRMNMNMNININEQPPHHHQGYYDHSHSHSHSQSQAPPPPPPQPQSQAQQAQQQQPLPSLTYYPPQAFKPPPPSPYNNRQFFAQTQATSNNTPPQAIQNMHPPPRQRTAVACKYCRRRKIRCSGYQGSGDGRCNNCIKLNQNCEFMPVSSQAVEATDRSSSSTNANRAIKEENGGQKENARHDHHYASHPIRSLGTPGNSSVLAPSSANIENATNSNNNSHNLINQRRASASAYIGYRPAEIVSEHQLSNERYNSSPYYFPPRSQSHSGISPYPYPPQRRMSAQGLPSSSLAPPPPPPSQQQQQPIITQPTAQPRISPLVNPDKTNGHLTSLSPQAPPSHAFGIHALSKPQTAPPGPGVSPIPSITPSHSPTRAVSQPQQTANAAFTLPSIPSFTLPSLPGQEARSSTDLGMLEKLKLTPIKLDQDGHTATGHKRKRSDDRPSSLPPSIADRRFSA